MSAISKHIERAARGVDLSISITYRPPELDLVQGYIQTEYGIQMAAS